MKRILIVEDDNSIAEELKQLLDNAGYCGIIMEDFEHFFDEFHKGLPELILLDINIPTMNGQLLLQKIRKESNVPIIMVTSRNQEVDEVLAMSYGADDYITKPYNPTILLLRIQAVLKRMEKTSDTLYYEDVQILLHRASMKKGEIEIMFTKNEFIIFTYLLSKRGAIVTRDELMTTLWNNNEYINDNALTVNISRLRGKLKEVGYEDRIETRKGQGYMLL